MFIAELFNGAPKQHTEIEPKNELVAEANAPQLVALYPGRFQPFHMGHNEVFQALQNKFGRNNVYIATSNKTDANKSPFNFSDKVQLMNAAGVPTDRILEVASPYKLPAQFDPAKTVFVVVVGAPDAARLAPDTTKKDGSESYFKTFKSLAECVTADQHGYCIIAEERHKVITLLGQQVDVSHGTPSRQAWNMVRNSPEGRAEYLTQMFGRNDPELGRILDKIPAPVGESLEEGAPIVVMPMLRKKPDEVRTPMAKGSFRQGVEAATSGQPYNNPYPFNSKQGPEYNYDHNSFKRGYKSVTGLEEGWKEKVAAGVLGAAVLGGGAAIQHTSKEWARKNPELAAEIEKAAAKERQTVKPINFSNNPYSNDTVPDLNDPTNDRFKLRNIREREMGEGTNMKTTQGSRARDPEELDSLVTSIGQKAKQGEMKTVWVPDQTGRGGRYRVVPVNSAPVEEDAAPISREEYTTRRKALQQIQMDPKITRDPAMRKELIKKIAQLTMQARSAGVLPESVYAAHVQENRLFEAQAIVNTIKYLKESASKGKK